MLARYLKAQLIVLVCGGIVGPIFLVVSFGLPAFAGVKHMFFFLGLIITAADVIVALLLANYSAQRSTKIAALEQSGVLALAQITGLGETGTYINNRPVVRVNLRIAGPGFQFDSQKRVTADITKQGNLTRGKLVVLVDPTSQSYEIDWQKSSLVNGMAPTQFTSTTDNRTYDLTGQAGPLMEIFQIYKANGLPSGGQVDLRAYPGVREQVMAVVRRAAAQQAPAAAPAAPAAPVPAAPAGMPPQASASQRLQELETLRATGSISEAEYSAKRERIISEL